MKPLAIASAALLIVAGAVAFAFWSIFSPSVSKTEETALFYARWVEREHGEMRARMQSVRDTLATSGPILCEDIHLGPPPAERVAACVPLADRAEARFVPDPKDRCGR